MSKREESVAAASTSSQQPRVAAAGGKVATTLSKDEYRQEVFKEQRWIHPRAWPLIIRRLYFEFFYHSLIDKGATLSFFTLLTAMPTLLAFYAITTLFLDHNRSQILQLTDEFISKNIPHNYADNARHIALVLIGSTEQSVIMLVISVLFALFSSSAYVRAFSRSANSMYGRLEGRSIIRTWATMWALTLTLVLGMVIIAGAYFMREDLLLPLLERLAEPLGWENVFLFMANQFLPVWRYVRWPAILLLTMLFIALLYHVTPNVQHGRFRWVTSGSIFAVAGIALVIYVLEFYLSHFAHIGLFGALGGVLSALFGLLIANTMLLLGIKLDAEVARIRELQAGISSEKLIRTPPRASNALNSYQKLNTQLEQQSVQLREQE
ncbi:YihY/virulence factor BrkB family protein [Corynebacterium sp. sy017]|uniref:YihY/virulence factor BrkB family protein n=1 Tax=unclassified Corynebacterium TaxID=2624378 RepID=UPI001186862B|nr:MULTISPECIES: YihY/virulence factor BrkB family protein [unclassified Corynebacterium]MBP3088352.1 YihY/virulence factor BrkB family protein [Corynebacterium sp. sy017]TSD91668.1 YihY/virulence factor BrkB family protein [Corynebacterium sp. SY003]